MRSRRTSRLLAALLVLAPSCSFLGGPGRHPRPRGLQAFPWESSVQADQAYDAVSKRFPEATQAGQYMGQSLNRDVVNSRFQGLAQVVGQEVAQELVEKEPILMLERAERLQGSFKYLQSLEMDGITALGVVQKNPRLLTVPEYEFARTKPTLSSLALTATVIDVLRPLGEVGLAVAIFSSFVVLILILRPLFYGVSGQQSVLSAIFSPVTSSLPSIPRPFEIAESYGINLASIVAIIPIYQVLSAITRTVRKE
mmetsp:Transcript_37429/g.67640  ORF Transcript_37429/g.67640 Transcript_37429/m.67640 type:complete len:254 (-) Transcript_37429:56-817(-)